MPVAETLRASRWRWPAALSGALLLHGVLLTATGSLRVSEQNSAGVAHGAGAAASMVLELALVSAAQGGGEQAPAAAAAPVAAQEAGGGGHDRYYARLRAHLQRHRVSLSAAETRRGTVVVGFDVAADGAVSGLRIVRSSTQAVLDAEAIELLRRSSPVPAPPDGQALRLSVPIQFE